MRQFFDETDLKTNLCARKAEIVAKILFKNHSEQKVIFIRQLKQKIEPDSIAACIGDSKPTAPVRKYGLNSRFIYYRPHYLVPTNGKLKLDTREEKLNAVVR